MDVLIQSLISVFIVSVISLFGMLFFSLQDEFFHKALLYLVSFSAGALFGDAFIHLIPEAMAEASFHMNVSLSILFGIIISFSVEKLLQWRHCHIPTSQNHPHSFAYMNIFGDAIHNFIDGLIISGSYLTDTSLGIATTLAVIFHEIPQEIGDFGVLIYGGFNKSRAILLNFLTSLTAIFGVIVTLSMSFYITGFIQLLIPFAAGNFIYIAGSDLIPELHKEDAEPLKAALQLLTFIIGILIIFSLLFIE